MLDQDKTRFRGAEEALRFYFRLRELICGGSPKRLAADQLPADACLVAADAFADYRTIGSSMRGLDEFALWLLSEVYGPTCFGVNRRTFSHAWRAAGEGFSGRQCSLHEFGLIHERALGVVKRGLRELAMIPADGLRGIRVRRTPAVEAVITSAKLHGHRAAVHG
ncbi:MAG TPA: hypothetical protein VGR40_01660 [Candidatus Binatus sp.]|nr:hypothetical protein [Candidatus Binatus sp.]